MAETDPLTTQRGPAGIVAELADAGFLDAHEIARGGFGVVYRCEQRPLERTVAVKVLTADLDDENIERFVEEQHAMGRLSAHPNIVTILQAGTTASGRPFLVMPYHRHESLEAHIRRRGPLAWSDVLRLGVRLSGALAAAHRVDVLHRDVKPGNILLTEYGEPELSDFGIARVAGRFHTAAGTIVGSPAFTAPEVLAGESASAASDVYGLGATMFAALTGHAAFERRHGEDVVAQFVRITSEPMPVLADFDIPADVAAVIEQAMARDPQQRPASAADFGELLRAVQRRRGLTVDDMAMPTEYERTAPVEHKAPVVRHNITADVTSFVGRGQEVRDVRALLRKTRLLTLTGIGGVGKSRIAYTAAATVQRAFRDGVWLIDFNFVQDGTFVRQAIADAVPGPASVLPLADQLRDKNMLLVLDNCDKLTPDIADTAAYLLKQCGNVTILATSRTPLDLSAEYVLRIEPFTSADADATVLFRDRAQAASGWSYEQRAEAEIAALCDRLDGLPLAIELAALRTRTMPIAEISRGLTDRFGLLKGGPRDVHPRHRSLWTLLEWTWDQCTPAERTLWAQFSVFVGSATFDAVRNVCVLDPSEDAVEGLVQQSILTRQAAADSVRFQMLNTIREFGEVMLERDQTLGSATALRDRHLAYFAALANRSDDEWFGPDQLRTSALVAAEIANMRSAFEWALETPERAPTATAMVADLWFYWNGCGHLREGRLWSEHAWNRVHELGIPHEAKALWVLGWNLLITGDVARAESLLIECVAEADRVGDARAGAFGRALLGAAQFFCDRYDLGVEYYTAAIDDARRRDDHLATAMFLYQLGEAHCTYREFDLADRCCRESIAICAKYGDQWCISYARWVQALAAFLQGSYDRAVTVGAAALETMTQIDDQLGMALAGELLAWCHVERRRFREAAVLLAATESYWTASGSTMMGFAKLAEARDAALARLNAALSERELARARAKGSALRIGDLAAIVAGAPEEPAEPVVARGPKPNTASLDALTQREREIAALVARGLTNKEIASELIIGKRTVDTHVAHVLAKCGLRRRSEIASLVAGS